MDLQTVKQVSHKKICDEDLIDYKESETPCTTTGGTAGGDACLFPFKKGSRNYVNCTTDHRDQVGLGLYIKIKAFFSITEQSTDTSSLMYHGFYSF